METKICTRCGRELPIDNFYWKDKAKGKRRSECKDCHNGYVKQQYQKKREEISELKLRLKCERCGYDKCPEVLEFHHLNPQEKDEGVSKLLSSNSNIDSIYKEIKKCVCLCANCHREFHFYEKIQGITIEDFLNGQ